MWPNQHSGVTLDCCGRSGPGANSPLACRQFAGAGNQLKPDE